MNENKVLLIDGYSILNRAFYGVPRLSNSKGMPTNAVYGFLNILFKLTDMEEPGYAAVAFDLKAPTFRHRMYDAYKGTRKPMPDELHAQVPVIQEILEAMGIPSVSSPGFEADDVLGTLARRAEKAGMEVMILSGDRDILQLVTDRVTVRLPKTAKGVTTIENYTPEKIKEVYGITPLQIIELKAMMGDSSDNIPGLPGVGEKTALALLAAYGSLENARAHFEELKPKKAMEAFRDHYELGLLSRDLATIRTDVPLETELSDLKLGDIYNEKAFALFKECEFKNLYPKFIKEEQGTPAKDITVQTTRSREDAAEVFSGLKEAAGFFADTEGETLFGLAVSGPSGLFYIPAEEDPLWMAEQLNAAAERGVKLSTCDLKGALAHLPLSEEARIRDVRIAAYLIDPLKSDYPYEQIASEYGEVMLPSVEEIIAGKQTKSTVLTEEQRVRIAAMKARAAEASAEGLLRKLEEQGMLDLYRGIEMPLVYTLSEMEKAGIRLNREALKEYSGRLSVGIDNLEREIYEDAGEIFNINSPKQLGVILFEKLHLPGGKKTKSGYSTAADVLEKLAEEAPIVDKILNYRQLTKLRSTYAEALGNYCDENGRIHTSFNQTVTATGRLSSTEPNLQNIPVRMELGREIRKVFVPADGCVFLDADYSQIELRVMAHLSGDEKLIEAYRHAADIHAVTASQVFGVPLDQVTPLQRRSAKAVNFGIIYGISAFGLSRDLNIPRAESQEYINRYFATYPGIRQFLERTVAQAKKDGFTTTMYGRRRPLPELSSSNFMQRQFGERAAMNSPIQGTAADIIKIAMNRVRAALKEGGYRSRLILQVHDELLLEVPEGEAEAVGKLLKEEMMSAAELSVTLEADLKCGKNWDDAH